MIDGSLGELSPFHESYGYYAHGVGPETAVLPLRWRERAIRLETQNTAGAIAHCLHPLDLAYSKLAAARPKDTAFVGEMIRCNLVKAGAIEKIIEEETADTRVSPQFLLTTLDIAKGKSLQPPQE